MRRRGGRAWALSWATALLFCVSVVGAPASLAATAPVPGAKPYVRLFTEAKDCGQNKAVNSRVGAELDATLRRLTSWFVHFTAQGSNTFWLGDNCRGDVATSLASKLSARGAETSNYRNGSSVSQSSSDQPLNFGEAKDLESTQPLSIATFWPPNSRATDAPGNGQARGGRLLSAADPASTVIRVTGAGSSVPRMPPTWPYLNSRGTGLAVGAHSANTRDFVSWIRIDDELMQVVAQPVAADGVVTLRVRRGLWGTGRVAHTRGARVLSPVYVGSNDTGPDGFDLSGMPARNDPTKALRYAIKIWTPGGQSWIARQIRRSFGRDYQGYNAVWLDLSSCSQFNHADSLGRAVQGWDDPLATKLTSTRWGVHQRAKFAGLHKALPGVRLLANNLNDPSPCEDRLLAQSVDGGALESWLKPGGSRPWLPAMEKSFRIQANNWPGLYWVRWDRAGVTNPAAYKRFSYGSLLLTYRPSATRFQYGGPFNLTKPDQLYFWQWGAPVGQPTSAAQLKVPGRNLYRRRFANGQVLVNPTNQPVTHTLERPHFDVVHQRGGRPTPVTSVTIPPQDAAFLLHG